MSKDRLQVSFRAAPRLRELLCAMSTTSGQSLAKVMEESLFNEAIRRVRADVRSGALKASESRIDIEAVRHDVGACYERLTTLLLEGYSHRLIGRVADPQEPSAPSEHPPTVSLSTGTERDAEPASRDRVARDLEERVT